MSTPRRNFLKDILVAGALPALLASPGGVEAATEMVDQAAQTNSQGATFEFDKETYNYWANYMKPGAPLPGGRASGVRGNKLGLSPISGTPLEREPAFLHYDTNQGFRTPDQIQPKELAPPQGDVSVQFSVAAFKPANEDRATFEKLQSGSLRVDMVQNQPSMIAGIADFAAWTAIAALLPDKSNKLPPLANLTFDPNSTWDKPQNMMLPRWHRALGNQSGRATEGFAVVPDSESADHGSCAIRACAWVSWDVLHRVHGIQQIFRADSQHAAVDFQVGRHRRVCDLGFVERIRGWGDAQLAVAHRELCDRAAETCGGFSEGYERCGDEAKLHRGKKLQWRGPLLGGTERAARCDLRHAGGAGEGFSGALQRAEQSVDKSFAQPEKW